MYHICEAEVIERIVFFPTYTIKLAGWFQHTQCGHSDVTPNTQV